MRQLRSGEVDYCPKLDKLIYTETKEQLNPDDSGEDSEEVWLNRVVKVTSRDIVF